MRIKKYAKIFKKREGEGRIERNGRRRKKRRSFPSPSAHRVCGVSKQKRLHNFCTSALEAHKHVSKWRAMDKKHKTAVK